MISHPHWWLSSDLASIGLVRDQEPSSYLSANAIVCLAGANRQSHDMEISLRNIALAVTTDDLTNAFAKILHKPPFQTGPLLNFEIHLSDESHPNGQQGTLTLPTEDAGVTFLRAHGGAGIVVKGRPVLISRSTQAIHEFRIERLNNVPWRDPIQLREEQERLLRRNQSFQLLRYSFGRFCRDGSFSSQVSPPGTAHVICDTEPRQIRFTFEPRQKSQNTNDNLFGEIFGHVTRVVTASYAPHNIATLVGNRDEDTAIVFVRADEPPVYTLVNNILDDTSRVVGLGRNDHMPPGCHSLMLAFNSQSDADRFTYACCNRLHLRYSTQHHIRIRDHTLNTTSFEKLHETLSQIPYKLGFEVEKTVADSLLSATDILSLKEVILSLQAEHGDDAPEIFRSFVSELAGRSASRTKRRKRRARRQSSQESLPSLLRRVTQEFIKEHQKPRPLLAPPPQSGVYLSYHLIVTPTRYILEGPVPDQSNSVLRRYGHPECFLRVCFQNENGSKLHREADCSIIDLLGVRYRSILLNGCCVAGRQFQFLGYSMSGLKEHSVWFVTPFKDEDGKLLNAQSIRDNLGNFSKLHKQPARLAARWSQAFSGTDPSITLLPEEIDFRCPDRYSPSGGLMTDGCSSISVELARDIWRSMQKGKKRSAKLRHVPSAFQFRLGGAKGMVVQDPTIQGKLVRLRPSQIKFDAPENLTFDVQSTSAEPIPVFLNRPLISLMEFLGVETQRIIELQDDDIYKAQSVRSSCTNASKVIQQHGLGASFHLPSLFTNLSSILQLEIGDTEDDPSLWTSKLIESSLQCVETYILRELKYRAHIAVPGSYTLLGVSDEWGCLREGEIYATVFNERTGFVQSITGKVAITRSPQIHPGDLQVVRAVQRPELEHLKNVVVFSCEGERALASCLGGGDLDGDIFNLILDPRLLPTKHFKPGEYPAVTIRSIPNACGISDVADFVIDYIQADLIGPIAISHLRFSDLKTPNCTECIQLAGFASQALDFRRAVLLPDFLAKEGANITGGQYYTSPKLLGQLFRRVPMKRGIPTAWNGDSSPSDGATVEVALSYVDLRHRGLPGLTDPSEELMEEMTYLLNAYCEQLLIVGQAHTISKNKNIHVSEAELVSGTIMANWSDHHRRRNAVSAMNLQTQELVRRVREELQGDDPGTPETETDQDEDEVPGTPETETDQDEDEIPGTPETETDEEEDSEDCTFHERCEESEQRVMAETFKRCWAAWCVAEDNLKEDPSVFGAQSFGLIALGMMLDIVKTSRLVM
ncbi:RdRP-domain-containing protein [Suillus subalutaceus]|uniref:RdRP-domain-containing protein n=1 Tax=Suillus subalutaceus TaxID=48586 RepID=UPI001B862682|nr:RdRP-domain-containing protein [Suillus subalutaceus]KAG1856675.1 RdRP-domain-containing protein [Suillus subalutaceus]